VLDCLYWFTRGAIKNALSHHAAVGKAWMDVVALPTQLPLLPIHNQVLLPTAFVRVQVSLRATRR
jgi:hypothetical protein